ncbi:hypothetical protein FSW04_09000 [Baekduia soli]|uniref:Glycosyltransferase RgtA/B/C/D-like domain-containing protein n=1 Tax=Baekduia soli TaxID=496014 RepID=A0A5B8U3R2_9ACTN|nr:hypothetical protein [Baekduia soli]QEC47696.1 hypothetical protein FSW04_09000 [Baekduia soli]
MGALRRALGLWLVLAAAYALTLAVPGTPLTGPEAHRLLTAESIVRDGDLDLADQYRERAWRRFTDVPLRPAAAPVQGRLVEASGLGFELLISPAYALGGALGVRLLLGALAAAGFCLAAALGRTLVPEPWATRAALVTGLSPPALGAATAISPEACGAAALAGALLLALRVRDQPRAAWALWTAVLVAALPWLAAKLAAPAAVVAVVLAHWLRRRRRAMTGFVALEVVLTSAVVYVTVHERLFGGLTPHAVAAGGATGADGLSGYLARWPRLARVWLDPHEGLLVWAPFLLLALVGVGLLWRSRRDRLAVAIEHQGDADASAAVLALVAAAVVLVAVVLAPALGDSGRGWWHARQVVPALPALAALAAWGLRFAPRTGAALAAVTVAQSAAVLLLA